eukprot:m.9420 g.9420  ORF g.9420 m.9420 type:complete len:457 (+) comp21345_c0_seq1:48-1418(+)
MTNSLVFEWKDRLTTATGWVVLDRVINGVSGGGTFMQPTATQEETSDIARNMSLKFTVTDPQIGGGKAGIRFDPADPQAENVLRRFLNDHAVLIRNVWVTAGDIGTDDMFIERVVQKDLGMVTSQAPLGKAIAAATKSDDLSKQLSWIVPFDASPYFPMIEAAVGHGIADTIKTATSIVKPKSDSGKLRVLIQGFGAVGSSLAYYLVTKNIGIVTGICDQDGFIVAPGGLPIKDLLDAMKERVQDLKDSGAAEQKIAHAKKNCIVNLMEELQKKFKFHKNSQPPKGARESENLLHDFILAAGQAEVFCPCATRYQVTDRIIAALSSTTWLKNPDRYVVAGANNAFGRIDSNGVAHVDPSLIERIFKEHDVCVIPDWVANSGTAQLFHRGLSVPFNKHSASVADDILEATAEPIRKFIHEANMRFPNESLSSACIKLAQHRLQNPKPILHSAEDDRT